MVMWSKLTVVVHCQIVEEKHSQREELVRTQKSMQQEIDKREEHIATLKVCTHMQISQFFS